MWEQHAAAGEIRLRDVRKVFGATTVLAGLNMTVSAGERLVLLGPSGCGKTTALRLIAGLETVSGGEIFLGGRLANDLEPSARQVAMVFQNYALYPHMTVWENIAFGLENRRVPAEEAAGRIRRALAMLNLTGLERRKPRELSGGQRQRVALARAVVKEAPYFLLDEPLSNLDAQLRVQARSELVRLHGQIASTMVYVTHDQVEAMTIGQRVAVLAQGVLQQVAAPAEIYSRPANVFVARFIGNPPMNIVPARLADGVLRLTPTLALPLPAYWQDWLGRQHAGEVLFGCRPEHITVRAGGAAPGIPARVTFRENIGAVRLVYFTVADQIWAAAAGPGVVLPEGGDVTWDVDWRQAHFFTATGGASLGQPQDAE